MSTTFESNRPADSERSQGPNGKLGEQFRELFDGVEDLIKRVSEVDSPEIQKIRAKARVALMMAKSAIADGATHVGKQARRAAGSTGTTCAVRPARRTITYANIPGTRSARERCSASLSAFSCRARATESESAHTIWEASYRGYLEPSDTRVSPRCLQCGHAQQRKNAGKTGLLRVMLPGRRSGGRRLRRP
jgi:ElaB/YqjD/DUF883 family membrane-anchored ribosome-binding protein